LISVSFDKEGSIFLTYLFSFVKHLTLDAADMYR